MMKGFKKTALISIVIAVASVLLGIVISYITSTRRNAIFPVSSATTTDSIELEPDLDRIETRFVVLNSKSDLKFVVWYFQLWYQKGYFQDH